MISTIDIVEKFYPPFIMDICDTGLSFRLMILLHDNAFYTDIKMTSLYAVEIDFDCSNCDSSEKQ